MTPRIIHVNNHTTYAVETAINANQEEIVLKYATATCNPLDQFCRKTGRVKAEGRLNSKRLAVDIGHLNMPFKEFVIYVKTKSNQNSSPEPAQIPHGCCNSQEKAHHCLCM